MILTFKNAFSRELVQLQKVKNLQLKQTLKNYHLKELKQLYFYIRHR